MIGRLSDRCGRRPLLVVCILGTAIGSLMLGLASSLLMLFASRLLDGLLSGNTSLPQADVSGITQEQESATGVGLLGAVFGL